MIESKYLKDNQKVFNDLKLIPTLESFDDLDLNKLLEKSKIRKYKPGELIIREDTYDRYIYILIYGKINIEKKGKPLATLHRRGDIFGEMSLLGEFSRTASAYADGEVVCLTIDSNDLAQTEENKNVNLHYVLYRLFAETLAMRLKMTNEELVSSRKGLKFW